MIVKVILKSFLVFIILMFSTVSYAAEVTMAWDASSGDPAGYRIYFGTSTGVYTGNVDVGNVTEYTLAGLAADTTYYFVVRAYNESGESGNSNEVPWIYETADTEPPVVSVSGPETVSNPLLNLNGTASDNQEITEVTWENNRGGSGIASGTSSWAITGITLGEGENVITISATDAAGNVGIADIYVTYTLPVDTTTPVVSISGPDSVSESVVDLSGTASDDTGVTGVTWVNDRGGSGVVQGTINWTITGIGLSEGVNDITVSARDAAGNVGSAGIQITYSPSGDMVLSEFGNGANADYTGTVEDTYSNVGAADTNLSTNDERLTIYTLPDSTNANPVLIKWELSAIPANASVQSAILYLYQSGYLDTGKDDLYEISVHKIINHNPDISKCTWSTYDGVNSWTGGADGGQGDVAAAEDIKMVDKAVGYKLWEVTQMVRDWVSNPTSNFGMMLLSDQGENKASPTTNRVFVPTENADAGKRPKLVITYSVSEVIAPPAPPGGLRVISP